jgi:isochorismate synthase
MKPDPILNAISDHYKEKLPFVIYALPGENMVRGLFQKDNRHLQKTDSSESGFLLAPFNPDDPAYFMPASQSTILKGEFGKQKPEEKEFSLVVDYDDRADHIRKVTAAIDLIGNSELEKVVISRKQEVNLNAFRIQDLCLSLFSEYQTAFRYLWYHPGTGIWCGATPELLLSVDGTAFKTMSLAGTRSIQKAGTPEWTDKEYMEQQLVTDAILEELKPFSETLRSSEIYTVKAGSIEHLRTDISGKLSSRENLEDILKVLHPTPAVCGKPRDLAREFIRTIEGYNRLFYTGYLGPVNDINKKTALYVNLRCMSIQDNTAVLYTGGGITSGSNPEAEWTETCNKQQTMLKLLRQFL